MTRDNSPIGMLAVRVLMLFSAACATAFLMVGVRDDPFAVVKYACPMHPAVTRASPGECPICGMALQAGTPSPAFKTNGAHRRSEALPQHSLGLASTWSNPALVLLGTLLLAMAGGIGHRKLARDALPDLTDPHVVLIAEWMGQSAPQVASNEHGAAHPVPSVRQLRRAPSRRC